VRGSSVRKGSLIFVAFSSTNLRLLFRFDMGSLGSFGIPFSGGFVLDGHVSGVCC
jgi:hypothetical protein